MDNVTIRNYIGDEAGKYRTWETLSETEKREIAYELNKKALEAIGMETQQKEKVVGYEPAM